MIKTEEGFFIVYAKTRMTKVYPTQEEAIEEMEKQMWNKIALLTALVLEEMAEEAQRQQKELGPDGN